ncbi:MAG: 2-amino-4-hydroxy-6-hydroxymethyldihydropteridine diphosphokinase [Patescibacteria group bacterium]
MERERIFLGLGSNLGDRKKYLEDALVLLEQYGVKIVKRSSIVETDPVGLTDQPRFLNMVVEVSTKLSPEDLLKVCLDVENKLGRVRTVRFGPRTIDIDILLYGERKIETDFLRIPHPRMEERGFVMEALKELDA